MRHTLIALSILATVAVVPAATQDRSAFETPPVSRHIVSSVSLPPVTVGASSWWKKALRGTARIATLGIVQAATDAVKQGEAFSLAFDHDGVDTDSYELRVNTELTQTISRAMLTNGTAAFQFLGGLTKGTYTFTVTAVGVGGVGTSAPLGLSVTAGNPSAPGQLRIIKGGESPHQ